jgi:1L-myo-inositol 1-phosphate cytidylyltransferase / CDP-L-myo-inositol myo-inositolphosphotransferase
VSLAVAAGTPGASDDTSTRTLEECLRVGPRRSNRADEETPVGIILAANDSGSDALAIVAAATLLERAVHALHGAGVEEIVVAVGPNGERIRDYVDHRRLRVRTSDSVEFAVEAHPSASRRVVLLPVDHIVEPAGVRRVLEGEAALVVAVKRRACGAQLEVGLAACDADVAGVVADRLSSGGAESAGEPLAPAEGATARLELDGVSWIDARSPADRRRAERTIVRRAGQQPFDGPVFRYVNRRLSWPISLQLVRAGVPPAAATAAAFVLALVAAAVISLGGASAFALVVGGLLVELASILDAMNGEIARASLRATRAGAFFDSILDRVADSALVVALAVAAGRDEATWWVLTAALLGTLLAPYVNAVYEAVYVRPPPRPILRLSFGRDVRLLMITLFAVLLHPFWGLIAVAVTSNVELAQRVVTTTRERI